MAEPITDLAGPAGGPRSGLDLVHRVLDALDAGGIRWCHWKSNEHVLDGLAGRTDLDLLVEPGSEARVEDLLRRHGYVEVLNPRLRRIAGLRDFLGVDEETGTISHLHVHHRLVLGERHVKEHHLPLERWLLAGDERRHGVRVPAPEQELLLLHVRSLLKTDAPAALRDRLRGRSPVPQAILDELTALSSLVDDDAVAAALTRSGLPLDEKLLREFLDRSRQGALDARFALAGKHQLLRRLRPYERHPRLVAALRRGGYRLRFDSRVQRLSPVRKKRLPGRGLYVAVVGADGSGKSRLVADLGPWLAGKLDVQPVYFGQPKGDLRWRWLRRVRRLLVASRAGEGLVPQLDTVTWLYLADHRRRLDVAARRHRDTGGVVLAERFPLQEFRRMALPMDGPRLHLAGAAAPRVAQSVETRCYDAIQRPDLVLVLGADLQLVRERKPETDPSEHAGKVAAVLALEPGPGRVVLDSSAPYDEVLRAAKLAIWDAVRGLADR